MYYYFFLIKYEIVTIGWLLKVNVGISEGSTSDHVPADPDGEDGPGGAELLVQHGLGDILVQVAHVQGGHRVAGGAWIHVYRIGVLVFK